MASLSILRVKTLTHTKIPSRNITDKLITWPNHDYEGNSLPPTVVIKSVAHVLFLDKRRYHVRLF